jgi:hypothetical protein
MSEAGRPSSKNLTKGRASETPGDFPRVPFLPSFLGKQKGREKLFLKVLLRKGRAPLGKQEK